MCGGLGEGGLMDASKVVIVAWERGGEDEDAGSLAS